MMFDIGTFGGDTSFFNNPGNGAPYMNSAGSAVGAAATPVPNPNSGAPNQPLCATGPSDVYIIHAFSWTRDGVKNLGALGPAPNGNCSVAFAINDWGEIAGSSENGQLDPLVGVNQARAVVWQRGHAKDLGTLGGYQSGASAINNRGQIVGIALNGILDPYSILDFGYLFSSAGTQTRAFLWQNDHMQDLGTLGGPDAWASLVNDRGQVAGVSYMNFTPDPVTGVPPLHPFLWENGKMRDLGSFGGSGSPPGIANGKCRFRLWTQSTWSGRRPGGGPGGPVRNSLPLGRQETHGPRHERCRRDGAFGQCDQRRRGSRRPGHVRESGESVPCIRLEERRRDRSRVAARRLLFVGLFDQFVRADHRRLLPVRFDHGARVSLGKRNLV